MKKLILSLVAALFFTMGAAQAHHSTAMFDQTKQLTLEGTVKEFRFTNPHSWIYMIVKNDKGEEAVWEIEGGSVSQMSRQGWTFKTLKAGDKVKVSISPRVDGSAGGAFKSVELQDGTVLSSSPRI